jgi:hypothetical protein
LISSVVLVETKGSARWFQAIGNAESHPHQPHENNVAPRAKSTPT